MHVALGGEAWRLHEIKYTAEESPLFYRAGAGRKPTIKTGALLVGDGCSMRATLPGG
jgi:hypothetical protein